MILSDADILERLEAGELVIDPIDDEVLQIQPASVDLRLGREFLEFSRTNIPCIHPNSEREVDEYVTETFVENGEDFILHPGDFVLGTTHERVEIPPDLIAHVEGRSSLGRLAVVVHASLPGDEPVFLWTPEDGFGFYEIGSIVESERRAHAVAFDPKTLRVSTHPITDYITNPTKRIYRITLESGRAVHVTRDHNLFTVDEAGGVSRIQSEEATGEYVMVPDRLPGPRGTVMELDLVALLDGADDVMAYAADGAGESASANDGPTASHPCTTDRTAEPLSCVSPVSAPDDVEIGVGGSDERLPRHLDVTPAFGFTVGLTVAAGSFRDGRIDLTSQNADAVDRATAWFDRYGSNTERRTRPNGVECLTVRSPLWARVFESLSGGPEQAVVPDRAWNWSDDVLEAVLDGVLDGSGLDRSETQTDAHDIVETTSAELADRLLYLSSRLGRPSSLISQNEEAWGESSQETDGMEWTVTVREDGDDSDQHVPVPHALLETLRTQAGLSRSALASEANVSESTIADVESGACTAIARSVLCRLRDTYSGTGADTTRLDQLLDGDVRFEKVARVTPTDRVEPTYDLEVRPNGRTIENFLGGRGGVFLSNTAGLCDPGYRGQITLELSNLGTAPVALTPGMRISQLTFTELKTAAERPYGSDRGSKYQDQTGPQASRIQSDDEFGGDQLKRDGSDD